MPRAPAARRLPRQRADRPAACPREPRRPGLRRAWPRWPRRPAATTPSRGRAVRALRLHPHPRRPHRRAAQLRLGQPLGPRPRPQARPGRRRAAAHAGPAPTRGGDRRPPRRRPSPQVGSVEDDVQRAVVLSLQGFAEAGSLDEDRRASTCPAPDDVVLHRERVGYLLRRRRRAAGAAARGRHALLLRGAADGRDRRRARRQRVPRVPDARGGAGPAQGRHELPARAVARHRQPTAPVAARPVVASPTSPRSPLHGDFRSRLSGRVPAYASTTYAAVATA